MRSRQDTTGCMRAAIYARYSSDVQSEHSIDDQVRVCRELAEREGWSVISVYADHAMSGASLLRPEVQRLIEDCRLGRIDVVVAEALDRISRDQEGVAGLYKRLTHSGVRLITRSEGQIDELHVGLKGTMNALFLKDLAAKTHRGLEGRVREGLSGGGISYGYRLLRQHSPTGEPIRGGRSIDVAEAQVIRRIFAEFAAGSSPLAISRSLNAEGVPGPGGRSWGDTTIRGNAERGTGILRNELYVGRLVWNRQRYLKDPDSGRRVARPNAHSEWIVHDVPDLRIVHEDLWQRVADRLSAIRNSPATIKQRESRFWEHRRPKSILTGRVFCAECGSVLAAIGKDYLGCNRARRRGACTNKRSVRREHVERVILDGLHHQLMAPENVKEFIDAFNREVNRERAAAVAARSQAEQEVKLIERSIDQLVEAIASGVRSPSVLERLNRLEARKAELARSEASAEAPVVRMHPNIGEIYRRRVADLQASLADPRLRTEAVELVRSLIERVVVTTGSETEIELVGDIAAMVELARSPESKKAAPVRAALSATEIRSVKVVAGARLRHQNALGGGNIHEECNTAHQKDKPVVDPWSPEASQLRSDQRFIHIAKEIGRKPKLSP